MMKRRTSRRDPANLPADLVKSYNYYRHKGFTAKQAYELAVFWGRQVVGVIGDANFLDHSGGPVFAIPESKGGQRSMSFDREYMLEYVEPPEGDFEGKRAKWTVYRVHVKPEVIDWVKLKDIASYIGASVSELQSVLHGHNPLHLAHLISDVASYHGWQNLDSYPLHLTKKEVEQRYGEEVSG